MMNDLISRQDAIDIVRNRVKKYTTPCVLAVTDIQQLPSADVQPVVHGEWIGTGSMLIGYRCSKCGGHSIDGKYRFCPSCGAKMDGKGAGNEND